MSLYAVEAYVQGILQGLTVPPLGPADAWVLPPPVVQLMPNPQLFIWAGDWT